MSDSHGVMASEIARLKKEKNALKDIAEDSARHRAIHLAEQLRDTEFTRNKFRERAEKAERERDELRGSLDFQYDCMDRARKLWQAAHPDKDYWPDGAKNIVWLLDKLDRVDRRFGEAEEKHAVMYGTECELRKKAEVQVTYERERNLNNTLCWEEEIKELNAANAMMADALGRCKSIASDNGLTDWTARRTIVSTVDVALTSLTFAVKSTNEPTADAVEILHKRYVKTPTREEALALERLQAERERTDFAEATDEDEGSIIGSVHVPHRPKVVESDQAKRTRKIVKAAEEETAAEDAAQGISKTLLHEVRRVDRLRNARTARCRAVRAKGET